MRITHIPTGIVVACQQERSQHKNRAKAWDMLRARLYERELKKREDKANAERRAKTDIGWGHQIRSYVLQPYQLVKDLRTGVDIDEARRRARRRSRLRSWRPRWPSASTAETSRSRTSTEALPLDWRNGQSRPARAATRSHFWGSTASPSTRIS